MFLSESLWIKSLLEEYCTFGTTVLNIGSSSGYFREIVQPYIHQNLIMTVTRNGGTVVNQDLRDCEGVDLPGDIYSRNILEKIKLVEADVVICSNMFEHVEDVGCFADILSSIINPGCLLIVTVPYLYPYHPDPIDNCFRPTPYEISGLFKGFIVKKTGIVESSSSYFRSIVNQGIPGALKFILRLLLPVNGFLEWRKEWIYLRYLFRPYSVSCIALMNSA